MIISSQFCKRKVKSTIRKLIKKPLKFQSKLSNWPENRESIVIADGDDNELSYQYHSTILEALSERECTNDVAVALNSYIEQACERVCPVSFLSKGQNKGPRWCDKECRIKRSQAVKAGERIKTAAERDEMLEKCREYRACKQRKKRAYKNNCIAQIEKSFVHNRCDMWHTLNSICNSQTPSNQPEAHEFYEHFLKTSKKKTSRSLVNNLNLKWRHSLTNMTMVRWGSPE